MDHAEVLERLETAALGPGRLAVIDADPTPAGDELRRHVAGCAACGAERRALELVGVALAAAAPDTLRAPAAARARILAAVPAQGIARGAAGILPVSAPPVSPDWTEGPGVGTYDATATGAVPRSGLPPSGRRRERSAAIAARSTAAAGAPAVGARMPGIRWFLVAAAAAVVVFVAGALLGGPLGVTEQPRQDTAALTRVLGITANILQGPGHLVASLEAPDGTPGGAVVISPGTGQLAVITQALPVPAGTARYECFVVRGGVAVSVGYMHFTDDTAWWAGPIKEPVDAGLQGDTFTVVLEGTTTPALTGTF